ncbi:hypothetical protein G6L15_08645 [Agrobacterium rhizogenes]|uniref:Gp138 family membrane-puncturing spike protein n=1 Tax=Rhizobium rhizogenes TaxID=359 RepID=UPI001573D50A|nr:Gp138 family membrane-puncturing spike protein [Rhizobium rhizogenes]NTG86213.1 hypothetical protein [Rhizobium rhizogenes]
MDIRERLHDPEETNRAMLDGLQAKIWTALPCVVVSVDGDGQHATFQPAIKSIVRNPDGTTKAVDLPVLTSVPMQFPNGGGASLTFPVKAGDEAMVVFSARPLDAWQQSGGTQTQIDARMHDLSDGMAMMGFRSKPRALSNVSTEATEIRTDDGNTVISLKGDEVKLQATGSQSTVTPTSIVHEVNGGMLVSITASRVDLGGLGGDQVLTTAGPSSKVYAVV